MTEQKMTTNKQKIISSATRRRVDIILFAGTAVRLYVYVVEKLE